MAQYQQINTGHIRHQATIAAWAQVYAAVIKTEPMLGTLGQGQYRHNHEVACQMADLAVKALEERYPQARCLSVPKVES